MTRRGQRRRPPGRRRRCRAEGKLRGRGGAAAAHHRRCALYRSQQRGRRPGWRSRGEHRCRMMMAHAVLALLLAFAFPRAHSRAKRACASRYVYHRYVGI